MRHAYLTILERMRDLKGDFETEPYEASWATEATFFIIVHSAEGNDGSMQIRPAISADGINWVTEEARVPVVLQPGTSCIRMTHFAGWVKLKCSIQGVASARITIQLHLKE